MAGIFGPKNPFGAPQVYATPGYGGGMPANPGLDTSVAEDPYAGQRTEPGFFGKGRRLRDAVGYGLGALAQQLGGSNPYEDQMSADRDEQHTLAVLRAKAEIDGNDPQALNLGDGGVATYSRNGGLNVLREPTPTDRRTPAMQNFEYMQTLPPEQRSSFAPMTAGFGYTPQGIAAQGAVAESRAAASERHRAPPRAGAYHAPHYEYRTNPATGQVERRRIG